MKNKTQLSAERRFAVLVRDKYRCSYCGAHATEIDHVVPRSSGGTNETTNLVAACRLCNARKGPKPNGEILNYAKMYLQANLTAGIAPAKKLVSEFPGSERTLRIAKHQLRIGSMKLGCEWYWCNM